MGKEFVEYNNENVRISYSASQLCLCLTQYVKEYIFKYNRVVSNINKKVRDAVLVDAINYLGFQGGCDFALYTCDLYNSEKNEQKVDSQSLLTAVINYYSYYIFDQGIVESVLINNHMNECTEPFDANDGANILLDFINYVAKINDYDKQFTIEELYDRYKLLKHKHELNKLKEFLKSTEQYNQKIKSGQDIDIIFKSMAKIFDLKYVAEDGTYHYTDVIKNRVGQSEMYSWDAEAVDEEIYAIAYAFAKLRADEQSKNKVIDNRILEMKRR